MDFVEDLNPVVSHSSSRSLSEGVIELSGAVTGDIHREVIDSGPTTYSVIPDLGSSRTGISGTRIGCEMYQWICE